MFDLQIFSGAQNYQFHLHYRFEGAARDAHREIAAAMKDGADLVSVTDEAGHSIELVPADITALQLVDLKKERETSDELAMMKAHADAKLNNKALSDPTLRAARAIAQAGHMPPMHS